MLLILSIACIDELPTAGPDDGLCSSYEDLDGDGFGDPATEFQQDCELDAMPAGDCDDSDERVHPGATELCNGRDEDCDGAVDDEALNADVFYEDSDGDGYGDDATELFSCTRPSGAVAVGGDCDDSDFEVNPSASEICNEGVDDDCDGSADGDDALGQGTFYEDLDGDGYGDPGRWTVACTAPAGTTPDASDCYDGNADAHPGQTQLFGEDRGDGSYDYDCDGHATPELTELGWCSYSAVCAIAVIGWNSWTAPGCGETGELLYDCTGSWVCSELTTDYQQTCN